MSVILISVGVALSAIGLAGLIWSIVKVVNARRAGLADDDLRTAIQNALPLNLGALLLSILGLMCVGLGAWIG